LNGALIFVATRYARRQIWRKRANQLLRGLKLPRREKYCTGPWARTIFAQKNQEKEFANPENGSSCQKPTPKKFGDYYPNLRMTIPIYEFVDSDINSYPSDNIYG